MIKKINEKEFHELMERENQFAVKFGAKWCPPCKLQSIQLDEIEEVVYEIDVDDEQALTASLGVRNLPRVKVFKSGNLLREYLGKFNNSEEARRFVRNMN